MNSIWLSLLWKEWCEFRWKLAALTIISVGTPFTIVMMLLGMGEINIVESLLGVTTAFLYAYAIIAGMFVGMSVAANENSHRTARFMRAWPVSLEHVALVKAVVAMLVIALPVVILMTCVWICTIFQSTESVDLAMRRNIYDFKLPWGIENLLFARTLAGILGTWSTFIWAIAGGVNRLDEVRAAAVAFLIGTAGWAGFAALAAIGNHLAALGYDIHWLTPVGLLGIAALPGGPGMINSFLVDSAAYFGMPWLAMAGSAIVVHALLLTWFIKRFGRVPTLPRRSEGTQWELFSYKIGARPPFRSPVDAIIWKQLREIGPLLIFAVVGIVTVAPLLYWIDRLDGGISQFGEVMGSVTIAVATLVILVTGIGLLYEDYKPGVESFWRSRPLNLNWWYGVKYTTGVVVQLLVFLPLLAFSYWSLGWSDDILLVGRTLVLFYLLLYSLTILFYSVVRQPIYAVVLTIGATFLGWMLLVLVYPSGPPRWLNSFVGVSLIMLIPTILATLLAWQAVVRDWGWKQHR
jgi:hypothetical protein